MGWYELRQDMIGWVGLAWVGQGWTGLGQSRLKWNWMGWDNMGWDGFGGEETIHITFGSLMIYENKESM